MYRHRPQLAGVPTPPGRAVRATTLYAALAAVAALACALALVAPAFGQSDRFTTTQTPTGPGGTLATIDLPAAQHMRNVGGSDGAGLCVFTSLTHSARWQNLIDLEGYRAWMQQRPGGGYPSKVDQTLAAFCKGKGVPVPEYIQHTGGDADFLDLAIKTGRCPAVTYCGVDGFYKDRWGRDATIAHMVNLAHLDESTAAIIDNNRPGSWVWMSRADFLARWRGNGGGWAVVFLNAPPPPHPTTPARELSRGGCDCKSGGPCECGGGCACEKPAQVFGQCPGGRCPVAIPAPPPLPTSPEPPAPDDGRRWQVNGQGSYTTAEVLAMGLQVPEAPAVAGAAGDLPTGVIPARVHDHPEYSHTGRACSKEEARFALAGGDTLTDDSGRWPVAVVGAPDFLARVRADVAAHPDREKLLMSYYAPAAWQVAFFELTPGVTLRAPAVKRVGKQLGTIAAADYSAAKLSDLIGSPGGPNPKSPPAPAPGPNADPSKPAPAPVWPWLFALAPPWVWVVGGAGLIFALARRL